MGKERRKHKEAVRVTSAGELTLGVRLELNKAGSTEVFAACSKKMHISAGRQIGSLDSMPMGWQR